MKVMGLFSGIGGFEASMANKGLECIGLCEVDKVAQAVLKEKFPEVKIHYDIRELIEIPEVNILTAGFPCQDLSQAGAKKGITGNQSRLVDHIFRLLDQASQNPPDWIILENVSYMLRLKKGEAMQYILNRIEELGFNWAYRIIDARAFGIPQRRERVVFLISKKYNPAEALFPDSYIQPNVNDTVGVVDKSSYYGFYWTEGKRGLGWTKNAVPTIKGGSGIGIPSPPAIWDPSSNFFGTPSINDAERLFGFEPGWTEPALSVDKKAGSRWKLVGNTLCVPMIDWIVDQIQNPQGFNAKSERIAKQERPPKAAYGIDGNRYSVNVSTWPVEADEPNLKDFLRDELKPLSLRASKGFYGRALSSTSLRFADGFLEGLKSYIDSMES